MLRSARLCLEGEWIKRLVTEWRLIRMGINVILNVMKKTVDRVLSHHTFQKRKPAAVPDLPNNQPHQSPKQSQAEDYTEQIEATSGEDHRWRTGRLQSRKEHQRADLQPTNPLWEISSAPARPLPCLHRLPECLKQGLACSFVGNHEEVHQHKPFSSHQKPL